MSHYKVIGQSVDNSLSPKLFEFIFKYLKIDAEYDYQNISDLNNLSHFIDNLILNNISGFNVTMPFKKDVLSYAHYVEEDAKNIAAANCIKIIDNQLYAYNTDHVGFSKFILHQGIDLNNSSVIVLGSGGSSQAILYSLLNQNIRSLHILSRNNISAKILIDKFNLSFDVKKAFLFNEEIIDRENLILINCTPIGNIKTDLDILDVIKKIHFKYIIDINYRSSKTIFNQFDARYINGLDMFIYQGLSSLDIWYDNTLSSKLNFNEIKQFLGSNE